MVVLVGINGFGRIGRIIFRTCMESNVLQVSAINDPAINVEYICYLIKFDSTHGKFKGNVTFADNHVVIEGRQIRVHHEKLPCTIPWSETNTKYVVEASGLFTSYEKASGHLNSKTVSLVLVTSPSLDIPMLVVGVNEDKVVKADKKILSCASSTLYCLAPIIKILDDAFGIEEGFVTSIHAMTPSLKPLDGLCIKGKHWRDHRSIHQNIIPASTGACKALAKIMPHVKDKVTGLAFRVPIVDVSVLDLTIKLSQNTSLKNIMKQVEVAGKTSMINIIKICREESVSSDFIGEHYSCIVDATSCLQLRPNFYKIICWYENEYSYACRVVDSIMICDNIIQYKLLSASSVLRTPVVNRGDAATKSLPQRDPLRRKVISTSQDRVKSKMFNFSSHCSSHELRIHSKYVQCDCNRPKASNLRKDKKQNDTIQKDATQYTANHERENIQEESKKEIDTDADDVSDKKPPDECKFEKKVKEQVQNSNDYITCQPITVHIVKKQEIEQAAPKRLTNQRSNCSQIEKSFHQPNPIEAQVWKEQKDILPLQKVCSNTKKPELTCNKRQAKPKPGSIYQRSATMDRDPIGYKVKPIQNRFEFSKSNSVDNHDGEKTVVQSTPTAVGTETKDTLQGRNTKVRLDTIKKEFIKMVNMTEILLKKSCTTKTVENNLVKKPEKDTRCKFDPVLPNNETSPDPNGPSEAFCQDENDIIVVPPLPFLDDEEVESERTKASELHQRAIKMINEIKETSKNQQSERKNKKIINLNQASVEIKRDLHVDMSNLKESTQKSKFIDTHNVSSAMYLRFIDERLSSEENKNSDINLRTALFDDITKEPFNNPNEIKSEMTPSLDEHLATFEETKKVLSDVSGTDLSIISNKNLDEQDIYDKLGCPSVSYSDNSFNERESQVLAISDLTNSLDDLKNIEQICQILEVSDELSDKLLSKLNTVPEISNDYGRGGTNTWSFKDFCRKIKLDDFCNDVLKKNEK